MNHIKKSLVSMIATSFFALVLIPASVQAEKSAIETYKGKIKDLNITIAQLDKNSVKARKTYAKTIRVYQKKHTKLTTTMKNIVKNHQLKRKWSNITKIKRLAKELKDAGENFEITAKQQLRKIYHIERNRTQRLHQRADLTVAWSIAFLSHRISKYQKEFKRIEEASIAMQIRLMRVQRDNLMRKRINIQDVFNRNMDALSNRESKDLKHFSTDTPQ